MQVNKKQGPQASQEPSAQQHSGKREVISKSVLTNPDRASPMISASGVTAAGSRVAKMNIKKTQIKLVNGVAAKRNSMQTGASNAAAGQPKSVSREGRIKVKLVSKSGMPAQITTPGLSQAT